MVAQALDTLESDGSVVAFPLARPANAKRLKHQRWPAEGLPGNVTPIRHPAQRLRLPDTPERAFIRAIGRHLTPKAYAGVLSLLGQQAEAGDVYSKAALLLVMDRA
jgi:hypothetical protein